MDTVERLTDAFLEKTAVQYELFKTTEENEAEIREVVRQGVMSGLAAVQLKMDLLAVMGDISSYIESSYPPMILGGGDR